MKALLLLVSQFAVRAEHDLQMAGEIFFTEQGGNPLYALTLLARNLQQGRVLSCNFRDSCIAQKSNHLACEVSGAVAFSNQMIDLPQHFFTRAARYSLHYFFQNV